MGSDFYKMVTFKLCSIFNYQLRSSNYDFFVENIKNQMKIEHNKKKVLIIDYYKKALIIGKWQ